MNTHDLVSESFVEKAEVKPFIASTIEKVVAFLMFPLSYIYVSVYFEDEPVWNILFGVFALGFIVLGELLYRDLKRTAESYYFMIATLTIAGCVMFRRDDVWNTVSMAFFAHLFAVYWILVRSDKLAEHETGHLFLWDGFWGFFLVPFNNFILILTTIKNVKTVEKKIDQNKLWAGIMSSILGIVLLAIAIVFLRSSDANYDQLMTAVGRVAHFDYLSIVKAILAIFISMYLYGLLGGCKRTERTVIDNNASGIRNMLQTIAKVPSFIWIAFIGIFSVFYVVYFVIQGSYLFDAFRMYLPQEFTYSEYARKGFSDMCAVMIINFIVLWLANRIVEKQNNGIRIVSTLLDVESILFAIIAFLKLYMYVHVYGFTPLRLQSLWLVVVMFLACICILISMYFKKKTAKLWFICSSALLVALCII